MKAALLGVAIWGLAFNANANAQDDQPFRLLALQGQYVKWGASATSGGHCSDVCLRDRSRDRTGSAELW